MVYPGKEKRGQFKASDYALAAAGMRVTARYSGAPDDLRLADEWEAQARTKQLLPTRTEIGAGGELIDRENRGDPIVDTVAHPDYVTAEASRDRLALANEAGSLSLALDAADTIQAQDGLEKMLVHQMAVLHYGMMRAAARMNEELDAAGVIDPKHAADVIDPSKREAAEAANVRACRLAGAISRMSATYQQGLLTLQRKRTGSVLHFQLWIPERKENIKGGRTRAARRGEWSAASKPANDDRGGKRVRLGGGGSAPGLRTGCKTEGAHLPFLLVLRGCPWGAVSGALEHPRECNNARPARSFPVPGLATLRGPAV